MDSVLRLQKLDFIRFVSKFYVDFLFHPTLELFLSKRVKIKKTFSSNE